MTDLSPFPPEVREAIEQFDCVTMHGDKWKLIRAELVRLATRGQNRYQAQIAELQAALIRWLPKVCGDGSDADEQAANDAMLLCGFQGNEQREFGEEMAVRLAAQPECTCAAKDMPFGRCCKMPTVADASCRAAFERWSAFQLSRMRIFKRPSHGITGKRRGVPPLPPNTPQRTTRRASRG